MIDHPGEARAWASEAESISRAGDMTCDEMATMAMMHAQIDAAQSIMSISNLLLGILEEMQRHHNPPAGQE